MSQAKEDGDEHKDETDEDEDELTEEEIAKARRGPSFNRRAIIEDQCYKFMTGVKTKDTRKTLSVETINVKKGQLYDDVIAGSAEYSKKTNGFTHCVRLNKAMRLGYEWISAKEAQDWLDKQARDKGEKPQIEHTWADGKPVLRFVCIFKSDKHNKKTK